MDEDAYGQGDSQMQPGDEAESYVQELMEKASAVSNLTAFNSHTLIACSVRPRGGGRRRGRGILSKEKREMNMNKREEE